MYQVKTELSRSSRNKLHAFHVIREHRTKARPQILAVILDTCDGIVSCLYI